MFATVPLSLVVAFLYLQTIAAAPASQPPSREVDFYKPDSSPQTTTPIEASAALITPAPARKRDQGGFGSLDDLVFPQKISASSTSSTASSTFEFLIGNGRKPTLAPEAVAARDIPKDAHRRAAASPESDFGLLAELSFPQKISSSSSSSATSSASSSAAATQSFGPARHGVTLDY
ncbi:MAG: hypothetical protein Q9220_000594 [cf. Caloplaca sp. 1 TL-2023]